ncbi:MAG: restriction endonuclease subunit S [Desulfobaccales bacterium]
MAGDWRKCEWGDIATLEYGKSLRGYQETDGHYRVFGTNGPIGWHDEPLCTHPGVIIGRKGAYRGVHYSPKPFFVIDTAFYVEPKEEMDLRWAYYCLLTYDINNMDSGSAIPSTSREDFYRLPVEVPPVVEQQAIACILGALDDKIELNRRMNQTLEAMARAIFKSWFVDFDPVRAKAARQQPPGLAPNIADLFPDSFEESDLGKIPSGWSVRPIGDVVQVVGGGTPSTKEPEYWEDGIHPFCTPKDMSSLTSSALLETERHLTDEGLAKVSSGQLPVGTVLLSSRAPIGYLAIAETPVSVNQGIIAIVCKQSPPNLYVLYWLQTNMERIIANANGSTFLEISKRNFRPIKAIVPPKPPLQNFSRIADPLYHRVVASLRQIHLLAAIRDVLLPKLISGELPISDAERIVGRCT